MNKHVESPVRLGARATEPSARRAATADQKGSDRFKAARRHSRRVRFFRVALPLGVVTAVGLTVAVNYLDPFTIAVDLPFELGRVSLSGTQVKMEFPRLHGFTADNRGYSVTAISASQDLSKPNSISLETIEAKLELAEHGWANLTASTGRYDTKTEQLRLAGGVRFDTSSGYGGLLQDAAIDIKGGKLVSKRPVVLTYLDGKLTADSIEVTQKDSRALLTGNVQLDFKMPPADDKDEPGKDAANKEASEKTASGVASAPKLRGTASAGATP